MGGARVVLIFHFKVRFVRWFNFRVLQEVEVIWDSSRWIVLDFELSSSKLSYFFV